MLLPLLGLAQQNNTTNTNFTNGLASSKFFNIPRGTTPPTTGILAGSLFFHTVDGLQYYDGSVWKTVAAAGTGVTSFNSRTGAVTPQSGDYSSFYVPLARALSTGYGLTGGGDLSANRTLVADTTSADGLVSKSRLATNLGGYVPGSRTITINGTAQDLSANRTYSVGTVTSIGVTPGTGISVTGSPITSSGNITVTNTAPDQTVVLTAGTGISTSGTYPNFTITNTSPSPSGLQDSLTKKANRTFDNVASGAIANVKLANSTISGVALGSNLNALTLGYGLTGTSYNGSSAVTASVDTTALNLKYAKGVGNAVLTTGNQSASGVKTLTDSLLIVKNGTTKLKVQSTAASGVANIDIHRGDVNGAAFLRYFNKNQASHRWQVGLWQGGGNKFYIQNLTTGGLADALVIDTLNSVDIAGNIRAMGASGTNILNASTVLGASASLYIQPGNSFIYNFPTNTVYSSYDNGTKKLLFVNNETSGTFGLGSNFTVNSATGALTGTSSTFTTSVATPSILMNGNNTLFGFSGDTFIRPNLTTKAVKFQNFAGSNILQLNEDFTAVFTGGITGTSATFSGNVVSNITSGTNFYAQKTTGGAISISGSTGTINDVILQGSNSTNPSLQIYTGGSIRYTIDASGNNTWTGTGLFANTITSGNGTVNAILSYSSIQGVVGTSTNHPLSVQINNAERGRFTSGGFFKASNDGTYFDPVGNYHELQTNIDASQIGIFTHTGSNPYGIYMNHTTSTNNGANYFLYARDGLNDRFLVYTNGGIANYSANNVNLSDKRVKKNIVKAGSYWDIIKAIEFDNYKYKDQKDSRMLLGVMAQQVESIYPDWINNSGTFGKASDGTNLKSVYEQQLQYGVNIVVQESQKRIEALEAEVKLLKSK